MSRPRSLLLALALTSAAACAYPRRTTPLIPVGDQSSIDRAGQPADMWGFELVRADLPEEKRTGLSWDEDGGKADPYVVLLIGGQKRWQSSVREDSSDPEFNESPPENLAFNRDARVRLELWDKDAIGADPIGMYEGKALGEALLGVETTIKLDSGASLTVRIKKPEPKLGVGIQAYEVRPSSLLVLKVEPNSPASRAGIQKGDRIVAIAGRRVEQMKPEQAESALTLASQNQSKLTVQRGKAQREVKLDGGYVWASM